jgi:5-formyltetrahydrofolate cyclo-ligase
MDMPLRAQSWETSKGTLVLDDQVVSFTIGDKTETMGVADIEPFQAAHLTLNQWLGWSGFLMWTGAGLLLAPFMILVPALLVDRHGNRLGKGGGSYDRALERVPVGTPVVVCLYDDEVGLDVPVDPHDRPVTAAVTPTRWILLR